MKFSAWLRQAREAKGWTRKVMAEKLGVHMASINNYETGAQLPDDEKLEKIADLFGANFKDLWVACNTKTHKRLVEIISRAEKQGYQEGTITDPEMKEIIEILNRHPHLKKVALGALRPLDNRGDDQVD